MYRLVNIVYLITFFFVVISCRETKTFSGKTIQMDYEYIKGIEDGSWIKIDGQKFIHYGSLEEASKNKYALPASRVVIDTTMDKNRAISINGRTIVRYLSSYILQVNKAQKDSTAPEYKIVDPQLVNLKGRLKISKSDSSLIHVEIPKNYPARISVVGK